MLSDQLGHPSESWHKASTDHHTCIPIKSKWTICFTDARFAHPSVSGRIMCRKIIFTTLSLDQFSSFLLFLALLLIFTMLDRIVSNSSGGTQNQHWFCFFCCSQDQDEILLLWGSQQGTPKVTLFPDTDVTKLYTCAQKQILTGQRAKGTA